MPQSFGFMEAEFWKFSNRRSFFNAFPLNCNKIMCLGDSWSGRDLRLWLDLPPLPPPLHRQPLIFIAHCFLCSPTQNLYISFGQIGTYHYQLLLPWQLTSQLSQGKKSFDILWLSAKLISHTPFHCYKKSWWTKTRIVNEHVAGKKMFCLWGWEGGEKVLIVAGGSLKGEGQGTKRTICLFPELD